MIHVDMDKFPRDCFNCSHCAPRHIVRAVELTRVCLVHAKAVDPHQLRDRHKTPCGVAFDIVDGEVPKGWTNKRWINERHETKL